MKKNNRIYGFVLIVLLLSSTSCLDQGGNEIMLTSQPAVVKLVPEKVFLLKGGDRIHTENMESDPNLEEGDCGLVDFVLDYSDAENIKENIEENGYYTASEAVFTELEKQKLYENLSDTGIVYSKERIVTDLYEKSTLIEKNLFLFTDHAIQFNVDELDLSYNKGAEPVILNDGKRVYDLYLRMTGDSIGKQEEIKYNVFDLASFISEKGIVEQHNGMDSLYFRIKYVSAIKTDSVPSWTVSQYFAVFLEN